MKAFCHTYFPVFGSSTVFYGIAPCRTCYAEGCNFLLYAGNTIFASQATALSFPLLVNFAHTLTEIFHDNITFGSEGRLSFLTLIHFCVFCRFLYVFAMYPPPLRCRLHFHTFCLFASVHIAACIILLGNTDGYQRCSDNDCCRDGDEFLHRTLRKRPVHCSVLLT